MRKIKKVLKRMKKKGHTYSIGKLAYDMHTC